MNNSPDTKKYTETLKSVKLSDSSRARMQKELDTYADFHAITGSVRATEESRSTKQVSQTPVWYTALFNQMKQHSMPYIAIVAILMVSGGTSIMAENSNPGDPLYSVKTYINDPFRNAFTSSREAEVEMHSEILLAEQAEVAAEESYNDEQFENVMTTRIATKEQVHTESDVAEESAMDADMEVDMSVSTSLMLEPIPVKVLVENTEARIESLRTVIEKHKAEFEAKVYADMNAKLDSSAELLVKVRAQANEDLAREYAYNAADLVGEVESTLSLLGTVKIDVDTGAIIDIDLSTPPPTEPDYGEVEILPVELEGGANGEIDVMIEGGLESL